MQYLDESDSIVVSIEMRLSLTSVQYGGFGDMDGGVPESGELESEAGQESFAAWSGVSFARCCSIILIHGAEFVEAFFS